MNADKNHSSKGLFCRLKTLAETYPFLAAMAAFFAVEFVMNIGAKIIVGSIRCHDGYLSPSIGHSGACSWHGGVDRGRDGWIMIVSFLSAAAIFVILSRGKNEDSASPNFANF
jgi:hypothetical protein